MKQLVCATRLLADLFRRKLCGCCAQLDAMNVARQVLTPLLGPAELASIFGRVAQVFANSSADAFQRLQPQVPPQIRRCCPSAQRVVTTDAAGRGLGLIISTQIMSTQNLVTWGGALQAVGC